MCTAQQSPPPPAGDSNTSRGAGRRANFGASLTTTAADEDQASSSQPTTQTSTQDNNDDDHQILSEGETCFICADPIRLYSVAPCDHRTCHICALRLLVLYKKDECTFCKTKISHLIFTSSPSRPFSSFTPTSIPYSDKKLPISFETKEALQETVLLLRFNCPHPNCQIACTGWKDYKSHIKREHNRLLCQLCIIHKHIFAHEHTLHTEQSLAAHQKAEHRLCQYDSSWFYSDDELFSHMRDRHEQCHICKSRGGEEERWKYYRDYDMLEKHFKRQHWLCEDRQCLANKFIVFETELDFKAHQVQEHANQLTTRQRREAIRIDANFAFHDGAAQQSSRAAVLPSRANAGARAARADPGPSEPRDLLRLSTLASRTHLPGAGPANHASRRPILACNLTSHSTQEKHQAYMNKVSTALSASQSRITSFRHAVRLFKNGESCARDLLSTLHSLVGGEMDDCAPLVDGLLDLLDDKDKSRALSEAWDVYRLERTQFPSLTRVGTSSAAIGLIPGSSYAGASNRGGGGANPLPSIKKPSTGSSSIPGSLAHTVAHSAASRACAPSTKWNAASASASVASGTASGSSTPKPSVAKVHSNSSSARTADTDPSCAFPCLPTNAAKASINAHKKVLFAARKSPSASAVGTPSPGSGASTPCTPPPVAGARAGLTSLNAVNGALTASQQYPGAGASGTPPDRDTPAARKKKGKGKGVQVLTFGGVHRG
ncbi:uncharacterized protein UBRO_07859 [Ustilago bromivora]|uniref:RING-type domain-containing protein n=1 Tax=Ustilago bromivora TaxID=307758 RepID=A0A1K0HLC6_9BASI|nr:uncharacterized protein UBRO_07859 [Ustilago bromivora]SYW80522.1 uncharacterized protein UBRO2_03790 [Ustilago bromivora]